MATINGVNTNIFGQVLRMTHKTFVAMPDSFIERVGRELGTGFVWVSSLIRPSPPESS